MTYSMQYTCWKAQYNKTHLTLYLIWSNSWWVQECSDTFLCCRSNWTEPCNRWIGRWRKPSSPCSVWSGLSSPANKNEGSGRSRDIFRSSGRWFTTFYHFRFWRYGFWDLHYQWSGFFSTQTLMEMQPPRANRKIQIFKFQNSSGAMGMWRWGMETPASRTCCNQETRIRMMAPGFTVYNRDSSTASRVPRWFNIGRLHVSFRFVQPSCDAFWPMASRGEGSMNEMNGDAIASVWVRGLLRCFRNMEVWIQFGLLFLDKS